MIFKFSLLLIYLFLAAWVSLHAVLRKRDSRAALFWVVTAWIMPFAGAFFYYSFGINRIERKALRLRRKKPRTSAALIEPPIEAAPGKKVQLNHNLASL